jgi:hypothetical protein
MDNMAKITYLDMQGEECVVKPHAPTIASIDEMCDYIEQCGGSVLDVDYTGVDE